MSNSLAALSVAQLKRAIVLKSKIEVLNRELSSLLGSAEPTSAPAGRSKKRRKLSAAGLASIRAGQKARWAKIKAAKK